jgi:hypothetical protein
VADAIVVVAMAVEAVAVALVVTAVLATDPSFTTKSLGMVFLRDPSWLISRQTKKGRESLRPFAISENQIPYR